MPDTVEAEWIALFGDDVVRMRYESLVYPEHSMKWFRYPIPLFATAKLRAVHICDHPEHLAAIAGSSSIRELTISIHGDMPGKDLFQSLASVRVERLHTICRGEKKHGCPFADPNAFGIHVNALA